MRLNLLFLLSLSLLAQLPPPGTGVERTMSRLAAATPTNPQTTRILFYGQSITKQAWWRDVAADLRGRYPHADLRIENRAIGGYSTPFLIRTMEADILPFHPDLVIFHDYGSAEIYEQIITWIHTHTTAEILLQSDHVTWLPGETDPTGARLKSYQAQEKHSFNFLPALARKYGLGLVDIRGGWHAHLAQSKLTPPALLRDAVHLNKPGEDLYAALTKAYLVAPARPVPNERIKNLTVPFKKNELTLDFTGTRLDLLDVTGAPLDVLVDGQRPAAFYHSRPTNTWDADWPTVRHVGSEKPLQAEEWTLKVTKRTPPGLEFEFELYGSRTGFDGTGSSKLPFVSRSGRVTLNPADYDIERSFGLHKIPMPPDWQIRWSTLPRFIDPVHPQPGLQTILYGLSNTAHRLTLRAPPNQRPTPLKLRIHRPPSE